MPWNPSIHNDWHAEMNWKGIWTNLFLAIALTLLDAFNYTSLSLARSLGYPACLRDGFAAVCYVSEWVSMWMWGHGI